MTKRGLSSYLPYSLALHAALFLSAILIMLLSRGKPPPMPYIVSLVDSPTVSSRPAGGSPAVREQARREERPEQKKTVEREKAAQPQAPAVKKEATKKEDDGRVADRIAALQAKKKIEKLAALRKTVDVSSGGSTARRETAAAAPKTDRAGTSGGSGAQSGGGTYYAMVVEKIRKQWIFPEGSDRDLEAVVAIRIARDGKVTIDKIEKGSGNSLFDRSVLRAIQKASPLPPPPADMEIGVRFRP
ncbi:MAG TPA: cell envelope integrity protein TolA [Dissulfurispiraceae bacterium]|nr:cell envelope integrity protein TolA [Dissulfurispiraceae bacterium]